MKWFLLTLLSGFFFLSLVGQFYIVIIYRQTGKKTRLLFTVYVWQYAVFRLRLPKALAQISLGPAKEKMKVSRPFVRQVWQRFKGIKSVVHCEYLYWHTRVGYDDAALTGLSTGLIWSVKSLFLQYFSHIIPLRTVPIIHVDPSFNEPSFNTEFRCIFSFKLRHLIGATLKGNEH